MLDTPADIANRMRSSMRTKGITNTALADATGVSVQAVGYWLKTGKVARQHLPGIAARLGTTTEYLLTGHEPGTALAPPTTLTALLQQVHPELQDAPRSLRDAIEALVQRYDQDPAEATRIARAIQALWGNEIT